MKINKQEIIFKLKDEWKEFLLVLKYFIKDPYYELKKLLSGYYNSTLIFWFTVLIFAVMWFRGILGKPLKIMGIFVFLTYLYMFTKTKKWKEYYNKEMIEGKEL